MCESHFLFSRSRKPKNLFDLIRTNHRVVPRRAINRRPVETEFVWHEFLLLMCDNQREKYTNEKSMIYGKRTPIHNIAHS